MRIRYRLILSFLLLALIPVIFLVVQTRLAMSEQSSLVNDRMGKVAEEINSGISTLNNDEIASKVSEGIQSYNAVMASAQVKIFLWGSVLVVLVVMMGLWLSKVLASPLETAAMEASRALQAIQSVFNNVQPAPRADEAHLVHHTLKTMETQVKDECVELRKTSICKREN